MGVVLTGRKEMTYLILGVLGEVVQACDVQLELPALAELAKTRPQTNEVRPGYRDP